MVSFNQRENNFFGNLYTYVLSLLFDKLLHRSIRIQFSFLQKDKLPLFVPSKKFISLIVVRFPNKIARFFVKKKRNNNKRKRKRDSTSRYTHHSSYLITPVSPLLLLLLLSMMEQLTNGEILTEKENGRMVSSFRSQNFANPSLPPSRPRAFKFARFLLALTAADYCFRHASAYIRPRISRGIKTPISLHSLHS